MNRRKLLAMGGAGAVFGLSGCIDELQGLSPEENGNDEDWYTREAICPEPPDDITEVEYEQRTMFGGSDHPLLEGNYWDLRNRTTIQSNRKDSSLRFSMITEETKDRINFDAFEADHVPFEVEYVPADRSFLEETDFETSVLLAFDLDLSGEEEFDIEAIDHETENTVHVYGCRFGHPGRTGIQSDTDDPEVYPHPMIAFIRIETGPTLTQANLTYAARDTGREPPETITFTAEREGESS